jgi:apolipoprotein N-acyltransferase
MSLQRPLKGFESWFEKNPPHAPLLPTLERWNLPLLTGLPEIKDWNTYAWSNAVGLIYPNGTMGKTYAKMHPVPFAEAIPFWEFSWFRDFMKNVIGLESGWVMGNDPVLFSLDLQNRGAICSDIHALPKVRFAAPICFEDAFAELCRNFILEGADVLINLTNDSWSRTTSAQIQHYAVARFRAIESRKTLVRSTNSGVTCVIGANGKSIIELSPFVAESAIVDVPLYSAKPTTYMRFGDWFAWLCAAFVGTMFAWSIWRENKIM